MNIHARINFRADITRILNDDATIEIFLTWGRVALSLEWDSPLAVVTIKAHGYAPRVETVQRAHVRAYLLKTAHAQMVLRVTVAEGKQSITTYPILEVYRDE